MEKQNAGRDGVQYQVGFDWIRLYYAPQTQALIGKKVDGQMVMQTHPIGPPDNCMARIYLRANDPAEFSVDRECVPVLDRGGPWVRETRNLEELNVYLSLFGLKLSLSAEQMTLDGDSDTPLIVERVDCKEPQDYCEHEPNFYDMQVFDVEFVGGEGFVIDAALPCDTCGTRRDIRFTIPESVGEWPEDEEDEDDES